MGAYNATVQGYTMDTAGGILPGHLEEARRLSSKNTVDSFGGSKNQEQARRMTSIVQGKTKMGAMGALVIAIDTDLVVNKQVESQHPLESGDLRGIIRIDDRIDPAKLNEQKYRRIPDAEVQRKAAEKERREAEAALEAERKRIREEEFDLTPSPLNIKR